MTAKSGKPRRAKAQIGDIMEVPLPDGRFGYIHYVNYYRDPPVWGPLVRVLQGPSKRQCTDVVRLAQEPEQYVTFFPVGAAVSRGYLRIVGHAPVPAHLDKKWPLFKDFIESFESSKRTWWLWNGKTSTRIGNLDAQHRDLPLREIINLTALEQRLMEGWHPRNEALPVQK